MLIIKVKDKNINKALKDLKGKFIKCQYYKELTDRKTFTKKSVKNRDIIKNAIYKEKLKNSK